MSTDRPPLNKLLLLGLVLGVLAALGAYLALRPAGPPEARTDVPPAGVPPGATSPTVLPPASAPGPSPAAVAISPVRVTGPVAVLVLQQLFEQRQAAFAECFNQVRAECGACLPGVNATLDLNIEPSGRVGSVRFNAVGIPPEGEATQAAASKFGACARNAAPTTFPAAEATTETRFRVVVMAPQPAPGGK